MTTLVGSLLNSSLTPFSHSDIYPQSKSGIVGLVGLQLAACIFGLGFTSPTSTLRPALLPIVGGSVWALGQTCTEIMPFFVLSNLLCGITCGWLTQYVASGILKQENFEDDGPSETKGDSSQSYRHDGTIVKRVWFGMNVINSQRNVGTPQQVKNVPRFSTKHPEYVPARRAFLLWTGLKMATAYLLVDFVTSCEPDLSQNSILFAAEKVPLLFRHSEVTPAELGLRAKITAGHWVGSYLFLQFVHSTLAFFTVLPGLYEPKDWPPLFGSATDIWSIRQYWGVFYHQLMRYKLDIISTYITQNLLQVPRGTLIRRYSDIFAVFFISGICHVMIDVWGSISIRECGAMQFFCMQAFGIMIEDGIQSLYRRIRGMNRTSGKPKPLIRVLGFAWTAAFLVWSTPAWIYPGLRHAVGGPKSQLLPFSVVKVLTQ